VVDIDAMLKCIAVVDRSVIPGFLYIHIADKHGMKNNSATKATFLDHLLKPTFSKVI